MEWLINRRRMMFNRVIPPEYLTFEDAEFWRICCENWGDYEETVITNNGNATVDIVTYFISKSYNTEKVRKIKSRETNIDNSEGTYIAGTTKMAVGITAKQCSFVTSFGTTFRYNTGIRTFSEGDYFTSITTISDYAFQNCTNLSSFTIPPNVTNLGSSCFNKTGLTEITIPSSVTALSNQCLRDNADLVTVYCLPLVPPSYYNCLSKCPKLESVYVPAESYDSYIAEANKDTSSYHWYAVRNYIKSIV